MSQRTRSLPARAEMIRAYAERDTAYEGVFLIAVRTTGIFCRVSSQAPQARERGVLPFRLGRAARRIPPVQTLPPPRAVREHTSVAWPARRSRRQ
jgi:hypothetical protein